MILSGMVTLLSSAVEVNAQAYTTAGADLKALCAEAVDKFHILTEAYHADDIAFSTVASTTRYNELDSTKFTHPDGSTPVRLVRPLSITLEDTPLPSIGGGFDKTSQRQLRAAMRSYQQADPSRPKLWLEETPSTLAFFPTPDDAYDCLIEAIYMPAALANDNDVVSVPSMYHRLVIKLATIELMEFRASGSSAEKLNRLRAEAYGPNWFSDSVLGGELAQARDFYAERRHNPTVVGIGAGSSERFIGGGRWR